MRRATRVNPYDKFLSEEDIIHSSIITYVGLAYPGILIMHAPLEGKRSDFEKYKAKKLGLNLSKGFPDFYFVYKGEVLYLEVKTITGELSKEQEGWISGLINNGQDAQVGYGFDACKDIIDAAFGPLKSCFF